MVLELTTALQSLKVASDIVNGFSALKTEVAINAKAIELQNIILSLQNQLSSFRYSYDQIIQEKSNLEKKIMGMESWESTKQKYILKEINPGVFTFVHKISEDATSDKHWLCANCFNADHKESILQNHNTGNTFNHIYSCPRCKNDIVVRNDNYQKPPPIIRKPNW